jgi:hypothetical protein
MNALANIRLEVAQLVLHFFITLGIIGSYLYTVAIGQPDQVLQNMVILSGGYWFGVTVSNKLKRDSTNDPK